MASFKYFTQTQADKINQDNPTNSLIGLGTQVKALTDTTNFVTVVKLTSAAAGTAINIVPVSDVTQDGNNATRQVFITDIFLTVNGATAWTDATATKVAIQDTAATEIMSIAKASLTGNAQLQYTQFTLSTAAIRFTGVTAGKGIQIVADANFGAGSDIYAVVQGFIK